MSTDSVISLENKNIAQSIPPIWHYFTATVALSCLFVGVIFNGFIIGIFLRYSNLRRPRNYFLINLAITDLGLLITDNSMHGIAALKRTWPFGQIGCQIYALCGGVFGLTSIATMAAIALVRLIVVLKPFSSLKLNSTFIIRCLIASWFYGSIWILPPLFGWSRFVHEGFGTSCTFDYQSKQPSDRLFMLFLIVGGFFIPLTIIIISYSLILGKLCRRGRRFPSEHMNTDSISLQSNQYNFFVFPSNNGVQDNVTRSEILNILDFEGDKTIMRNIRRIEMRATRTAVLVCGVFCLAWGPYSLAAILSNIGFDQLINPYATAMLGLFTKTAACVNPLIYAWSSRRFRAKLRCCLKIQHYQRRRRRQAEVQSSVANSTFSR